jgi:hypothetical protein
MSGAVFWRPGDSRSLRADRVPLDMRLLGRLVPLEPEEVDDTVDAWLPLSNLAHAIDRLRPWIGQRVVGLPQALQLSSGFYPHMAKLPFGGQHRDLLVPGMYVITDTSREHRMLYVGSSVGNSVRSRLISHLYADGRMYSAQRAFRYAFERLGKLGFECEEDADRVLRRALWSRNRWLAQPGGLDGDRERAAELVADGAFDIAIVAVPESHAILARCLERFATELVRSATGSYPPLNGAPVALERDARPCGTVSHREVGALFAELGRLARDGQWLAPLVA